MTSKKFVLLDVDYITKNRNHTIRLFGKLLDDNDQKHIIAMDNSFKPYIYAIPSDSCINELEDLELNVVEKVSKKDMGKIIEVLKITFNHPRDITKLKEKILNLSSVEEVREHDIPFERRYLIDKGLSPMG